MGHLLQILLFDSAVLRRIPDISHLIHNQNHFARFVRIDEQLAEFLPDEIIEQLLCDDIDKHIRRFHCLIGDFIMVRAQCRMNPRRINHLYSVPVISMCHLCRDPLTDGNILNTRESLENGRLACAVLPCKYDAEGLIRRKNTLRQSRIMIVNRLEFIVHSLQQFIAPPCPLPESYIHFLHHSYLHQFITTISVSCCASRIRLHTAASLRSS